MKKINLFLIIFSLILTLSIRIDSWAKSPMDIPYLLSNYHQEDSQNQPQNSQNYIPIQLSNAVRGMEQNLEAEFENFFSENLADVNLAGAEISQKLLDIAKETNTRPGVLWIIQKPEFLHLVLITPGGSIIVKDFDSIKPENLSQLSQKFYQEITNPTTNSYLKTSQQLYQWLIKPVETELKQANIDTILLCLGNGLRTLPLSALHDGDRFLVEKYQLTTIPAFNLIDTDYKRLQNAKVLAMGASKFKDQQPLPAVELELATIVKPRSANQNNSPQSPINGLWPGQTFINEDFTINNLQNQLKKDDFLIIHLATHADFQPGDPNHSYIQFSDQKLTLNQMGEINWNKLPAELLVLSACKTAFGSPDVELGFAGLALKSGVKSALASLWYVSDEGTLALMSEFYLQLKNAPTKSQALRQAQLAMIQGKVGLESGKLLLSQGEIPLTGDLGKLGNLKFTHPFYWSAFSLISSPF